MMSEIRIQAHDGSGDFMAYIARPDVTRSGGRAPAVIVIQEIFGVNHVMRDLCDGLADQGYLAICPDLFWRQEPGIQITDKTEAEWQKAFSLFSGFDLALGIDDLKSTLTAARNLAECSGKVATQGYCLGGKLAFLMAARSDADCNISYYGVGLDEHIDEIETIRNPLLMHVAELDKFVPQAARIEVAEKAATNKHIKYHLYAGVDHAFARVAGEHYDAQAATLANQRSATFLAENLT